MTLYADASCARKVGATYFGAPLSAPLPAPVPGAPKAPPVSRRWPLAPFIVGGNALTVVFESASDYLKLVRRQQGQQQGQQQGLASLRLLHLDSLCRWTRRASACA